MASGVFWDSDIEDNSPLSAKKGYGFNLRFTIAPLIKKIKSFI